MIIQDCISHLTSEIKQLYLKDNRPWFIGFSGGKDSTALVAIIYISLKRLRKYHKKIYLLYCDTGVEIPALNNHSKNVLSSIKELAKRENMPFEIKTVKPRLSDRFFVNLIGKGYPPPTNKFRWCNDRLRSRPIKRALMKFKNIPPVLLLGIRYDESNERSRVLKKYSIDNKFSFRQAGNKYISIFAPLAYMRTQQIWELLLTSNISNYLHINELVTLYESASGGICPKSCNLCRTCRGSRFGCWVCTVIRNDKSMTNMSQNGFKELSYLIEFKKWLIEIRENRNLRHNNTFNGLPGMGAFNLEARQLILGKLMETERNFKGRLLSRSELKLIEKYWALYDYENR
jgi:DNA sulfur modification protein DndC